MYKVIILFVLCGAFVGIIVSRLNQNDYIVYDELIKSSGAQNETIPISSHQTKEGVIREIWIESNPKCIHFDSENAHLGFLWKRREFKAVECLNKVSYVNENISLRAETAQWELQSDHPTVNAHHISGSLGSNLTSNKTSVTAEEAQYDGEVVTLDKVVFIADQGCAFADKATIDFCEVGGNGLVPSKITLMDHVRLSKQDCLEESAEQFALADKVTYFPEQEEIFLEGRENNVLFYDPSQGMQLSAQAIRVARDPKTKKECIQGIGDVRFLFSPNELERLKDRFKWD